MVNGTEPGENPIAARTLLLFGAVFSSLTFVTITPALPSIAKYFAAGGDDTLRAQLVLTMAVIGMAVGGIAAGAITSRLGLKRTAVLALTGCGTFGLSILVLPNIYLIYIDRFFLGWSAVTVDICVIAMLGARYEGATRAKLIGFRQAIASSSTVIGTLIGGALVQQYGWRVPSTVFAAAFVYALLMVLVLRDRKKPDAGSAPTAKFAIVSSVWILYFLIIAQSIANTMPHFQLPFLLAEDGMDNAATMSRFPAASALVSIMGALAFGWIYSKMRGHTATVALTLMGVSFIVISLTSNFAIVLVAIMVEGFGGGMMLPYLASRILEKVPQEARAHAYGSLMSILFVGQFFNPLVIAPLRLGLGIHGSFGVVGVVLLIIAAAMPYLIGLSERPAKAKPNDIPK